MRIALIVLALASLAGCAAATEPTNTPEREAVPPLAAGEEASPTPAKEDTSELVPPTKTQDFPASCTAARFTSPAPTRVADATTGLTWLATDVVFDDRFPTPTAACGFDGFRAATTAEVLALGQAIPGCTLPGLMSGVYQWATFAGYKGALPIVTSDGCVDVKSGTSFAGTCAVFGQDVSRSTLCVK